MEGPYSTHWGFINRCDKKHKYDVGASPSLLKSLHVMPLRVFGQIYSLIFIEGFTKFRGKEVALVVVYRLSKFCQFIGLWHPYPAQVIAQSFFYNLFKLYGMPVTMTSDRDPFFMSSLWWKLFTLQRVKLQISNAYHLQIYG